MYQTFIYIYIQYITKINEEKLRVFFSSCHLYLKHLVYIITSPFIDHYTVSDCA